MKTTIHTYTFNTSKDDERRAYEELSRKLVASGVVLFRVHGDMKHTSSDLNGIELDLETEHLFDNQWNTAPVPAFSDSGLRVFDWYECAVPNRSIRTGHWLEMTDEMRQIRRDRVRCGYCGRQESAANASEFCGACIDSEYLKEPELYLTRMQPIDGGRARPPLTEAEAAILLPEYRKAQIRGATAAGTARLAKQRADIEKKCATAIANAQAERDGQIWLLDRGIKIDNVIYYDHTGRFSFGWRAPVSESLKKSLLEVLAEFPFAYDVVSEGK